MDYIQITKENIDKEHICCAMSGKQSLAKKEWLKQRFAEAEVHDRQIPQRQSQRANRAGAGDEVTAMTRSSIFSCFMSFVAGGCMVALVMFCARHPTREMLLGWAAYLLLAFALAYKLGGALIL